MTDHNSTSTGIAFTERLQALRAQWAERASHTVPPLSADAERACLAELDEVCGALSTMRDDLRAAAEREAAEAARAEAALTETQLIPTLVARVATTDDAMRALGACVCNGVGRFPERWIDRAAYMAQMQASTKEIDCLHGQLGAFTATEEKVRQAQQQYQRRHSELMQQQAQQQYQRQQIEQQLEQKQQWLNKYLYSRTPYDATTLDPQLKALNGDKAALVYRLRVLECQGHAVPGLNALLMQHMA